MSYNTIKQPEYWQLFNRLYENPKITFIRRPQLPLTTIAVECAAAWNIPVLQLKGKIQQSNRLDKTIKYSFLFALYLFSDCKEQEVESHFGYGRALPSAGQYILYEGGSTTRKYGKTLQSFFSTLLSMCPGTHEQWRELAPRECEPPEVPEMKLVVCIANDLHIFKRSGEIHWWNPVPSFKVGSIYTSYGLSVDQDGDLCHWIKEGNSLQAVSRFVYLV